MPTYSKEPGIRVEYDWGLGGYLAHLVSRREDDFQFLRSVLRSLFESGALKPARQETGPNGALAFRSGIHLEEPEAFDQLKQLHACERAAKFLNAHWKNALPRF